MTSASMPAALLARWTGLTRGQRLFLAGWCLIVFAVALVAANQLITRQSANLDAAKQRHAARVGTGTAEPGQAQPELTPPPGHEHDVPADVRVGIYLDRIADLSIIGSTWKADFYVWFHWRGNIAHPGESFQVVNGEIQSKTLMEQRNDGRDHYALYRVAAQITKNFDIARFPRDDHLLTLSIEDSARQSYQLRYLTDEAASDISSRVAVTGYQVVGKTASVRPHSYKTARGNPALPADYRATYSQFSLGVLIGRPDWGLFAKLTVILYAAVAMALLALFIRSSGDRLSLQTGAMFAAAANAYIASSLVPGTGTATLADQINWLGIACIGLCLIEGVIYQHWLEGKDEQTHLAWLLDRATFVLAALLYLGINFAVACAASL
jgi:hypothetical protein